MSCIVNQDNIHTLTLLDRQCAQALGVAGGLLRLLVPNGTKAQVKPIVGSNRSVAGASKALLRSRGGLIANLGSIVNFEAKMNQYGTVKCDS